jgi:hypothetical protein
VFTGDCHWHPEPLEPSPHPHILRSTSIFSSHIRLRVPNCISSLDFPTKILCAFLIFIRATFPPPSHSAWFEDMVKCTNYDASYCVIFSRFLLLPLSYIQILPSILSSRTLISYSTLRKRERETKFLTHMKQDIKMKTMPQKWQNRIK